MEIAFAGFKGNNYHLLSLYCLYKSIAVFAFLAINSHFKGLYVLQAHEKKNVHLNEDTVI